MHTFPLSGPILDETNGKPDNLVIFFHGYGSNGADLLSLGQEWADALPSTVFVGPNAPHPMGPGYQWYDIYDVTPEERKAGIHACLPSVHAYIDALMAHYHVPANHTALVGFSQGGSIVLQTMTERTEPLAAVISYSGFFTDPEQGMAKASCYTPTLLIHGKNDDVVPFEASVRAQEALKALGPIRLEERPHLGHSIDVQGMAMGCAFLKDAFNKDTLKTNEHKQRG